MADHRDRRRSFAPVPIALLMVGLLAAGTALAMESTDGRASTIAPVRSGPSAVTTSGWGPEVPAGVWIGAWSRPVVADQAGRVAAIRSFEARSAQRLDLVHSFHDGDQTFPSSADVTLAEEGRILMVSWAGEDSRSVTLGRYDDEIRQRAKVIREFGRPMLLRWRWEMDRPNLAASVWSSADYIAAWKHARAIFAAEGATNAGWVWCPLASGFADGKAQSYYPGDDQVDWLCADVYPGPADASFAEVVGPFLDWAGGHPRPVMIGEFGAERDDEGSRFQGEWLKGAASTLAMSRQVRAAVYFEGRRPAEDEIGEQGYDYSLLEGSPGLFEFRALASLVKGRDASGAVADGTRSFP